MQFKWLYLSIVALALSGAFSCFVVLLRLPFFVGLIPNIFDVSLIIHVTLGINAWMLAITASTCAKDGYAQRFSYKLCFVAVLLIFLSGFVPETDTIKNNYIPFLDNLPYILGIALLLFGFSVNSIDIIFRRVAGKCEKITASIFLISQICLCLAYVRMPSDLTLLHFYEYLFWGGGHILQFVFCQTFMIVCTVILGLSTSNKVLIRLSWFNLLAVFPAPFLYYYFASDSETLEQIFTYHMRILGGIAPTIYIFYLLFSAKSKASGSYIAAFTFSASLFLYGGLLGFLIRESNVIIPAHYHGSIIGITLAFMAFAYHLTGKLSSKLPMLQLATYTVGQFAHITGLLLMGGYGALRKSVGMTGGSIGVYKAIFFTGGSLSILSGGLFVILLLLTLYRKNGQC